ncbi:alpha/beta fold hydrolase [Nocardioides coralli]|uniref:alpha/beta fold hydrolase n=1 Tax=Nocardioides coralli TaxID=2872154 RepID=UPI001CA4178A|nr:alpha/beta hydrolase [Nocardioides coralli]QZY28576.1 alpha/beta fold hydrolase [Nocardioides coralli]
MGEIELCVDEYGDQDDPVVVLVAGAAQSMDWWDPAFCAAIAAGGRRVVRYDHRDTGASTTRPRGRPDYPGSALGDDLTGLVTSLRAGPAHLVGMSMGGGLAQAVALRRPDLVSALTLVATSAVGGVDHATLPGPEPRVAAVFDDPPPDPDWDDQSQVVEWLVAGERVFGGSLFDETRTRRVAETAVERSIDPGAAANHWLVVGDGDGEPLDVRRISCPTLVVHGTEDPFFPLPHGEALAAAVPGARLLVVEGMGHEAPPPAAWDTVVPRMLELGPEG